jgi:hypothetical protein
MTGGEYPSGLRELPFVQAYYRSTLRKPQVVSDTVLRSLMTSGQDDRLILVSLLADQLGEACRRLAAVYEALFERTFPVATVLRRPLPGVESWAALVDRAATIAPDAMLRNLGLGEEALAGAEKLRSQPDLSWTVPVVAASASGNILSLIASMETQQHRIPDSIWVGTGEQNEDGSGAISVAVDDAATLADTTADMVSIARSFLGAYLDGRVNAGRRDE